MNKLDRERLKLAVASLKEGKHADGTPVNMDAIASAARSEGMAFTRRVVEGGARATQKLHGRRFIG